MNWGGGDHKHSGWGRRMATASSLSPHLPAGPQEGNLSASTLVHVHCCLVHGVGLGEQVRLAECLSLQTGRVCQRGDWCEWRPGTRGGTSGTDRTRSLKWFRGVTKGAGGALGLAS